LHFHPAHPCAAQIEALKSDVAVVIRRWDRGELSASDLRTLKFAVDLINGKTPADFESGGETPWADFATAVAIIGALAA
jgi:hypothetical protein